MVHVHAFGRADFAGEGELARLERLLQFAHGLFPWGSLLGQVSPRGMTRALVLRGLVSAHLVELAPFLHPLVNQDPRAVLFRVHFALAVLIAAAGAVEESLGAARHRADALEVLQDAFSAGRALLGILAQAGHFADEQRFGADVDALADRVAERLLAGAAGQHEDRIGGLDRRLILAHLGPNRALLAGGVEHGRAGHGLAGRFELLLHRGQFLLAADLAGRSAIGAAGDEDLLFAFQRLHDGLKGLLLLNNHGILRWLFRFKDGEQAAHADDFLFLRRNSLDLAGGRTRDVEGGLVGHHFTKVVAFLDVVARLDEEKGDRRLIRRAFSQRGQFHLKISHGIPFPLKPAASAIIPQCVLRPKTAARRFFRRFIRRDFTFPAHGREDGRKAFLHGGRQTFPQRDALRLDADQEHFVQFAAADPMQLQRVDDVEFMKRSAGRRRLPLAGLHRRAVERSRLAPGAAAIHENNPPQ